MAEPTPGPWQMEDRRHAPLKNIRVVAGQHEVCEVSDVHQRDYQGSFRGDHEAADKVDAVGLANAQLIAAAPELLSACKAALPVIADAIMHGMPVTQEVADARNGLCEAIRKAEGGSNG